MRSPASRSLFHVGAVLALASLHLFSAPRVEAAGGPSNGKIAFTSQRDGGNSQIYTMNADGTAQANISNNAEFDEYPSWSPDGTKIAYLRAIAGNSEIFVMNADGSNQARLTFNLNSGAYPAWSPDGTKIAFRGGGGGFNTEIYVMNVDGTGQTQLTNNSALDDSPAWSPDGAKIVFHSNRDGNDEIYVMNADGSGQTRLTNNTAYDHRPAFSPDGTKIVFSRRVNNQTQVFVMSADGTGQTQLTSSSFNYSAAFSPDGEKITFESNRDSNMEIYVMDADGSNQTRLTDNPAYDYAPAWQPIPDGDTIGVFRPSTGQFLLRNSNTPGPPNITVSFGQSGDQPLAGDWNGDGKDDVGVFRNGQFLLRQPRTFGLVNNTIVVNFGLPGDLAVVGDWNGDGIDTPGVFRPSTGQFRLTNSPNVNNSSPPASLIAFSGQAGDKPVAGDWNGDGLDTVGLYRESAACAFFLSNNHQYTGYIIATGFCAAPPVSPVMGDWNGDGVSTLGIYSGSQAVFSLSNRLTGPPEFQVSFGQPGDLPVSGNWNGSNS